MSAGEGRGGEGEEGEPVPQGHYSAYSSLGGSCYTVVSDITNFLLLSMLIPGHVWDAPRKCVCIVLFKGSFSPSWADG